MYNKAEKERIRKDEKKQIHRRANSICLKTGRNWKAGKGSNPKDEDY